MSNNFFSDDHAVYEILWKNMVQPDRAQLTKIIRRMRFAGCIPKATDPRSEYVMLNTFARQQWLRQRASLLRLYPHCLCCSALIEICIWYSSWNIQRKRTRSVQAVKHICYSLGMGWTVRSACCRDVLCWQWCAGAVTYSRTQRLETHSAFGLDAMDVQLFLWFQSVLFFFSQSFSVFLNFIHRVVFRRRAAS